jgi:hypothetical protein
MSHNSSSHNSQKDKWVAILAILYLLFFLAVFGWLLFDTWIDAHTLARLIGYKTVRLETPLYQLVAYTIIGGAIGGIVNGIRSFLDYYSAFNRSYFWKYITAPWMGAALAMIGFALLGSTVAIVGGEAAGATADTPQFLANFGIGALAGYGSKDVFIWLDSKVSKLFAVPQVTPDVTGQPKAVAASQIHSQDLSVGAVATTAARTSEEKGIVVDQAPAPGTPIDRGQPVDMVVGASPNGEEPGAG